MSKTLEAVIYGLQELNDTCGCVKFDLPYGKHGETITILVPPRGRGAFRSLLLEVARHEHGELLILAGSIAKILDTESE